MTNSFDDGFDEGFDIEGDTSLFEKEIQKFTPDNLVILFAIDCTELGGEILRFTSASYDENTGEMIGPRFVTYNGEVYTAIPVEAEGFELSSTGTLPQPKLRVLNSPSLTSGIIALNDMLGATVYRTKTFRCFLDDGSTPDVTAHFPMEIYTLDRKSVQNKVFVEWELAAAMDQQGRMIPNRQIIKDYCTHIYRHYDQATGSFDYSQATCPYTGSICYNEKDQAVPASGDRCGKRLSSCKLRFGNNAQLPTRAFPGVSSVR